VKETNTGEWGDLVKLLRGLRKIVVTGKRGEVRSEEEEVRREK
jgi:hypothetical protein